jgi:uncharacterized protein YuzE
MKIKYDKELDVIYIRLQEKPVAESEEKKPGIILDYDHDGNIVGIEMLDASKKIGTPTSVIYELA